VIARVRRGSISAYDSTASAFFPPRFFGLEPRWRTEQLRGLVKLQRVRQGFGIFLGGFALGREGGG